MCEYILVPSGLWTLLSFTRCFSAPAAARSRRRRRRSEHLRRSPAVADLDFDGEVRRLWRRRSRLDRRGRLDRRSRSGRRARAGGAASAGAPSFWFALDARLPPPVPPRAPPPRAASGAAAPIAQRRRVHDALVRLDAAKGRGPSGPAAPSPFARVPRPRKIGPRQGLGRRTRSSCCVVGRRSTPHVPHRPRLHPGLWAASPAPASRRRTTPMLRSTRRRPQEDGIGEAHPPSASR